MDFQVRYCLTIFISFVCGLICASTFFVVGQMESLQIRRHWQAVHDYHAFVHDPLNLEAMTNGMAGVSNPPDPIPHLDALVRYGKLQHADLVLPAAPDTREAYNRWVMFSNEHDDIVHSTGGTQHVAFTPAGKQPLHFHFWYRSGAEPKIQKFIRELESLPHDGDAQNTVLSDDDETQNGK